MNDKDLLIERFKLVYARHLKACKYFEQSHGLAEMEVWIKNYKVIIDELDVLATELGKQEVDFIKLL